MEIINHANLAIKSYLCKDKDSRKMKSSLKLLPLLAAILLMTLPLGASAQTKKETSRYKKLLKKPTLAAAEKYLQKYPNDFYAPKVISLRDSLELMRRTSQISHEEALGIAGECLDAIGWRKDGVDHVLALYPGFVLRILSPKGVEEGFRDIPVHSLSDSPAPSRLAQPLEVISPLGKRNYLHFAYLNGDSEYVEILYLPEEDIANQAIFYGNPITPAEGESYRIEGESPEWMEGLTLPAETYWLAARLRENPSLVPLAKADILTDASIRWWREKNPKAETSATRLTFGVLDPESSIVAAYKKSAKERGKSYNAALFDIRGYTVICAANKRTGEYTLVWCEPVCKNRGRDKFLNTIYFENDGNTLDLFYYKGKKTFKLRISMASQSLKR